MAEEEDKAQEEKKHAREEAAAKLREELKQRREEARGNLAKLQAEILETSRKIAKLVNEDNDIKKVRAEIEERTDHLGQLHVLFQLEFSQGTKKSGDYTNWVLVFSLKARAFSLVDVRDIKEREKEFKKNVDVWKDVEGWKKGAEGNELTVGEVAQLNVINRLDKMLLENYKFTKEARIMLVEDNLPALQFQAEIAEVMLKVRERLESSEQLQAKTANILDGILKEQKQMREQMFSWKNFLFLAGAALVGTLVLSKQHWQTIADFFKDYPLVALSLVIVIGVFAGLEIRTRVKKKN